MWPTKQTIEGTDVATQRSRPPPPLPRFRPMACRVCERLFLFSFWE